MRGYKTLIQEAGLIAMPPEAVAAFFKERAAAPRQRRLDTLVDQETEASLLARNEPLINLSLAQHGRNVETLAQLFWMAEPSGPIRLACLSNCIVGAAPFQTFPVDLFGNVERMSEWLAQATKPELSALFENSSLGDSFLHDLLERSHGWESLSEDRLCEIASILSGNPRMQTPREDDWMDGYAEYRYGAVFDAAWALAGSVEPTEAFASALGWLYEDLETNAHSIKDPLALADRWNATAVCKVAAKREAEENERGSLSDFQRVRRGLARLAMSTDGCLLPKLLASDDVAFRCCGYALGRLSGEQILGAQDRDGEMAIEELIRNKKLWQTADQRQALHDAAWNVAKADEGSDLLAANLFQNMEREMQTKHPDWFKDVDTAIDPANATATRGDLATLAEKMDRQEKASNKIQDVLARLASRSGWIWWFSLGAMAASLLRGQI